MGLKEIRETVTEAMNKSTQKKDSYQNILNILNALNNQSDAVFIDLAINAIENLPNTFARRPSVSFVHKTSDKYDAVVLNTINNLEKLKSTTELTADVGERKDINSVVKYASETDEIKKLTTDLLRLGNFLDLVPPAPPLLSENVINLIEATAKQIAENIAKIDKSFKVPETLKADLDQIYIGKQSEIANKTLLITRELEELTTALEAKQIDNKNPNSTHTPKTPKI